MRLTNGEVLLRWPLSTHIITAGWTYNDGSAHNAIDLRAAVGTPVYASEGCTVDQLQHWDGHTRTGMQSYGNMLRLRLSDYRGQTLQTRCAHLSRFAVEAGQPVREGDLLGYSGESGNCYGAHLHFEVILDGRRVNPLNWLDSDFSCASDAVRAHLGSFHSMEIPSSEVPPASDAAQGKLQRLTIGPVDNATAMLVWERASGLRLGYSARYADAGQSLQILTIGPVSIGDAMTLWQMANDTGAAYKSEWVEG